MTKYTETFVHLVLGVLLLALGHAAYARDYAVELIVFERPDAPNEAEEVWNFSSEHIADKLRKMHDLTAKSIDYKTLSELDNADTRYQTMPALDNLAAISNNLVTAGYQILYATNWIQPAATYRHAPLISFGTADSSLPYGFIKVYKTSLIFADINIQYSPTDFTTTNTGINTNGHLNAPEASPTDINQTDTDIEPQQPHFFISEKRRLKFKEIHYFDHPLFGVIVGVWSSES